MDPRVELWMLEAESLVSRFKQGGESVYINGAIVLGRRVLAICPSGHPKRLSALNRLADHLFDRHFAFGGVDDLHEAIVFSKEALVLCPPGHPDRSTSLNKVAFLLFVRHKKLGGMDDLDEAVVLDREALALCPPGHPDRSVYLNGLASRLFTRYNQLGGTDDLNEAIPLARDAVALSPPGRPDRALPMNILTSLLFIRYKLLGTMDDLGEVIALSQEALLHCPSRSPFRPTSLNNLAHYLATRYEKLGEIDDIDKAIALDRESLGFSPPGHPLRPASLNNLALHLSARYNRLGGTDVLNEAILFAEEAVTLFSPGHPDRASPLNNLAALLSVRYKLLGGIEDLDEAIVLAQDALVFRQPGHPLRSASLHSIASHLFARYKVLGAIDDLDEAIVLARDAVTLCPPGNQNRPSSLNNLANFLMSRYQQLQGIDDLKEVITLGQEALVLSPPGDSLHAAALNNLAYCYSARYERARETDDLDVAIVLDRKALAHFPSGHPTRPASLNNLASHLLIRYEKQESLDDLDEATDLAKDALKLCLPGHSHRATTLNNLCTLLITRCKHLGGADDLDEAIILARDALEVCPPGHPLRSTFWWNLAQCLYIRFGRLGAADDLEEVFSLYAQLQHVSQAVSSVDLYAAKGWIKVAEECHHATTLVAYETALRLLIEHVATLPPLPHHLPVLKNLSSSLAADAFSACLRNQVPAKAVELLEQGRGVFWSQLTRLRSPLDDVVASGPEGTALAGEFTRLTTLIRTALNSPGEDQHDRVCRLNLELQKVVSNIQKLPELSRFLLPPLFSDLQRAASGGPVIILNASKFGCDALIIFADKDPVSVPLAITKENVRGLSLELRKLTKRAKSMDMTRDLHLFLRELWDSVVSHIIAFLQTVHPVGSRIWWCPTAEFSHLPLHAATPLRTGQRGVSNLYISSYTPTLAALIRARRPSSSDSASVKKPFIGIGQANAAGANKLHSVGTELAHIGELVDGRATFTRVEGEEAKISKVMEELGKHAWLHLACHGVPDREHPFASAFALHDGHFTIEHILQCNPTHSEFAYLSACHTTVGDEESPDEVIHLASAMQFAGFRSVIGTMWAVDDAETNKVTAVFYKHMTNEEGCLDHTLAAAALRKTMKTVDIPVDQRMLYIHLGA